MKGVYKFLFAILLLASITQAETKTKIKAVVFDAFPVFDPRPVFALAEDLFPGKGADLSNAWRTKQFEYTWLRTASGRYEDFWNVTQDALVFAARSLNLELTPEKQKRLMDAYLGLKPYPDVLPALKSLKDSGVRLAFLSNLTPAMLEADIKSAGLDGIFEKALSTDPAKTYKPSPAAYQLAMDALGLQRDEIVFAAFAGWDAAGSKWFGYKTFWVNRMSSPKEEFDAAPDATGKDLNDLVAYVKELNR